jgi:uncharacterized protein YdeI (YjbR/CyaY-like superfamily)
MIMANEDRIERFHAAGRAEWRAWLERNHAAADGVWLVTFKRASGKPSLSYSEAVEEALCFGWIDSVRKTVDEERSMQYFSPRRRGSPWSKPNKERVGRLLAAGLVAPAGMAKIDAAKQDGSWEAYDAVEAMAIPADLAAALAADATAQANFTAFTASTKKQLLGWIASAKRPATRAARIERLVAAAAENRNPVAASPQRRP